MMRFLCWLGVHRWAYFPGPNVTHYVDGDTLKQELHDQSCMRPGCRAGRVR